VQQNNHRAAHAYLNTFLLESSSAGCWLACRKALRCTMWSVRLT
jgi:hypothetical protein